MFGKEGTERNYAELGAAIVEMAAVDYVDALIIEEKGYISVREFRRNLYKATIAYGKNRYMRKGKFGMVRQDEARNRRAIRKIERIIQMSSERRKAKAEIKQIEAFFHSNLFALAMPHTDVDEFIRLLRLKAEKGERVKSQYAKH